MIGPLRPTPTGSDSPAPHSTSTAHTITQEPSQQFQTTPVRIPQPHPAPSTPVGGRLQHHLHNWRLLNPSKVVLDILQHGYKPQFTSQPPLTTHWENFEIANRPDHPIIPHVEEMLRKQAIEVVDPSTPGLYCHLFTRPKKTGGTRPIINCTALNRHLDIPSFKQQTVGDLMRVTLPGQWASSIDLTDAYFHVPLHPHFRKYLRFVAQGVAYQFRALPFGLATAPRIFTKMVEPLAQFLHAQGIIMYHYLDDWLIKGDTPEEVACNTPVGLVSQAGLPSQHPEVELRTYQDICLCGRPVQHQYQTGC